MFTPTLKTAKAPIPRDELLRAYICGPTVYNSTHLGHARTYITFDIIRSILENVFGNRVIYQMNITDVDDKIIRRSNELGIDFIELARKYESEFFADLANLNVRPPTIVTRVTEYMEDIIKFIRRIMDNGYAYCESGSVYFDTEEFSKTFTYPKLRAFDDNVVAQSNQIDSSKNMVEDKRHPSDFALWKAAKENEPFWESEFGRGRPGWHIECSVMAVHALVNNFGGFDFHFGGRDLEFPHHANEVAQIEAYYGREVLDERFGGEVVKAFMHSGHLRINDEIMSKSKMNFKTVSEVLQHYTANQLRVFFLQVSYDTDVNYSVTQLDAAVALEARINNFLQNSLIVTQSATGSAFYAQLGAADFAVLKAIEDANAKIMEAYCNSFGYPAAFSQILAFIEQSKQYMQGSAVPNVVRACRDFVIEQLAILGVQTREKAVSDDLALKVAQAAADFRGTIKAAASTKDALIASDFFRDEVLPALGFAIEDGERPIVKQINAEEWAVQRKRAEKEREEKERRAEEQKRAREEKIAMERELSKVRAEDMFRGNPEYCAFDEEGVPTEMRAEDGSVVPVPKSRQKKLKKEWETRKKLNEKYQ